MVLDEDFVVAVAKSRRPHANGARDAFLGPRNGVGEWCAGEWVFSRRELRGQRSNRQTAVDLDRAILVFPA